MMTDCELPDILHHPPQWRCFFPAQSKSSRTNTQPACLMDYGETSALLGFALQNETTCYINQSICKLYAFSLMINLTDFMLSTNFISFASYIRPEELRGGLSIHTVFCSGWHITLSMDARYILNNIVTTVLQAPSGISSVLRTQGTRGKEKVCAVQFDSWLKAHPPSKSNMENSTQAKRSFERCHPL